MTIHIKKLALETGKKSVETSVWLYIGRKKIKIEKIDDTKMVLNFGRN